MKTTAAERAEKKAARKASEARIALAHAEAQAALAFNSCPACNRAVKRNLALTGWVQCSQYGAVGFRADSAAPNCGWQGFTE
jgi:hypothetical protein